MSKLGERIRNVTRRRPAALGFTSTRAIASSARQVLVIASVDGGDAARTAIDAGADVLIARREMVELAEIVAMSDGRPIGVAVENGTYEDSARVLDSGADFLVFDDNRTDAEALLESRLGYVARTTDLSDSEVLRLLRPLELDAVVVPQLPERMTVRDQARLRRVLELVRKPLVVELTGAVSARTLEVWRDAGAIGVLVQSADLVAAVQAADAVPPPREPRERPDAILPSLRPAAEADEDDDDPF